MATNILQAFNEFKSRLELNETLQNAVTTHHEAIREWVESYNSNIKTQLIGSLQRKTRIHPRINDIFDIDILVILGEFHKQVDSGGIIPTQALDKLESIVKEHGTYRKLGVETDSPAVVFEYRDGVKVELIPAWRDFIYEPQGRGYRVPKRNMWVSADYDYDADYVSKKNDESDGWLIPTIKMLKAAKRNLFPEMKSYHLEVLATNIIPEIVSYYKSQRYQISYPSIIFSFFLLAKNEILKSSKILGSKSPDAGSYMNSFQRNELAEIFKKISNFCQSLISLDGRKAIEGWQKIFGEPFPSYG